MTEAITALIAECDALRGVTEAQRAWRALAEAIRDVLPSEYWPDVVAIEDVGDGERYINDLDCFAIEDSEAKGLICFGADGLIHEAGRPAPIWDRPITDRALRYLLCQITDALTVRRGDLRAHKEAGVETATKILASLS